MRPALLQDHPCGARSLRSLSCGPPRANPASWPITARFDLISQVYCQNDEVSLKSVHKACHSPYIQKRVQKSPLGFLGFPLFVAFSHKELMGRFDPYPYIKCQNGEVSPDVHTGYPQDVTRKGRQIPPTSPQQAASGDVSSSGSARYSQRHGLFLKTRHILAF